MNRLESILKGDKMILNKITLLVLIGIICLSGCTKSSHNEIRLYAGAGMRNAVDALTSEFENQSDINMIVDYGGSGIIISRAKENPDTDLFMPGDVSYVDRLQELTGNIESKSSVSYFVPIIIAEKGNPKNIRGLKDFARKDIKVALGKAKVCQIGKLSAKLFERQGMDSSTFDAQESLTVNELGVWVKMSAVDAAVVWDAIAANIVDDVEIIPIPKEQNIISQVVVGLMRTSKNKRDAQKFIDFIGSPKGQRILKEKGYKTKLNE